jgi:hypothetical protein
MPSDDWSGFQSEKQKEHLWGSSWGKAKVTGMEVSLVDLSVPYSMWVMK